MTSVDITAAILMLMSGALGTAGSLWWLYATFSAGIFWGLGCLFIPILGHITFTMFHFKEAKGPLGVMMLAVCLFFGGAAVAKRADGVTWMFFNKAMEPSVQRINQSLDREKTGIHLEARDTSKLDRALEEMKKSKQREKNEALLAAVREGNVAKVESYLNDGADPNLRTLAGTTALMEAAAFGYSDVVEVLLRMGADPFVLSGEGKTAMDFARENGRHEISDLLQKNMIAAGNPSEAVQNAKDKDIPEF